MRSRRVATGWTLLAALALSAVPVAAEVSVDILGPDIFQVIVLGVTEGPDPFGMWAPVRQIAPERILNPTGAARGDGRPDIADGSSKVPIVTWAYRTGTDYDIAVSTWIGQQWSEPQFLSQSTNDELDPRIHVGPDGSVHVVWWQKQTGKVFLATRLPDSDVWLEPQVVTPDGGIGRYPSVAVWHGNLVLAYERDANASGSWKDIMVARRDGEGGFTHEVAVRYPFAGATGAMIHSFAGILWLDWRSGAEEYSYARSWGSSWGTAVTLEWTDFTWTGIEQIHLLIRNELVQPDEGTPDGQSAGDGSGNDQHTLRAIDGLRRGDGLADIRKVER